METGASNIGKIILIAILLILILGASYFALVLTRLSAFRQVQTGQFPKVLPAGYSSSDVVADTFVDSKGMRSVSVIYLGNNTTLSFSQEKAPLVCDPKATGIISDYSVFSPVGFDAGCSFLLGSTATGTRVYTWGKNGNRYNLLSKSPFISAHDATNFAESLTNGSLSSSMVGLLKMAVTPFSF